MCQDSNNSGWGKSWPAPAKLNLMLRITGRRDDGYHLLQTVFQIVDLSDWLVFHPVDDNSITLVNPTPGVPEVDDLTVRAAQLLQKTTGCHLGVRIAIQKNLPMGGGLGGGSSDAATTLVVLNKLWGLRLSTQALIDLGVTLGADVPVFVKGASAWGEGIGELLASVQLPKVWFVIIKPNCHVNTKQIFSDSNLTRDSKSITMGDFVRGDQKNDCQQVVAKKYPAVNKALVELSKFGVARLTGTGACVFSSFETEEAAAKVQMALRDKWEVYLAKGVDISPLQQRLAEI